MTNAAVKPENKDLYIPLQSSAAGNARRNLVFTDWTDVAQFNKLLEVASQCSGASPVSIQGRIQYRTGTEACTTHIAGPAKWYVTRNGLTYHPIDGWEDILLDYYAKGTRIEFVCQCCQQPATLRMCFNSFLMTDIRGVSSDRGFIEAVDDSSTADLCIGDDVTYVCSECGETYYDLANLIEVGAVKVTSHEVDTNNPPGESSE